MKIIKASAIIRNEQWLQQALQSIEYAARISHRSEDGQTADSAAKFIQTVVIDRGDWSVVEHVTAQVEFIVDRGITHEIVRHRLFSFTQECIAGDTRLSPSLTIERAYQEQKVGHKIKSSDGNIIVRNAINHIYDKGIQPVLEVITKSGYRIKTTLAHEFQTEMNNFKRLEDLTIGNKVMVNGRRCIFPVDDESLYNLFFEKNMNPFEIADQWQVPYSSVTRRLRKLGIFRNYRNDKNKEKYNKNHTLDSYLKMKDTILEGYRHGRQPWNKGLSENESASVMIQGNSLRSNHHNNGFGEANSCWKGGVAKTQRSEARRKKKNILSCEICNSNCRLEVHHIDERPSNNNDNNLIKLCRACHLKVHCGFKLGIAPKADEIISIKYVGMEHTYDLEMKTHHNYVANGFIVHNSTRFVNYKKKMPPTFIYPQVEVECPHCLAGNEPENVEGLWLHDFNGSVTSGTECVYNKDWLTAIDNVETAYKQLLEDGWRPQEARSVLPNALSSKILMTGNLRNWRHFFLMRTTKQAHPQMREVTIPLLAEFQKLVPVVFDDINPDASQIENVRKGN